MFRPLSKLFGMFSRDLGIDLGTANTLVYVRGKGIVISEPSVVAIDTRTRRAFGVGVEAKAMVGKTPESIVAVRPLKDGVIADFDTVEMMLHYFIRKVHMQRLMAPHPRVVIGIPSGVTEVEKRAAKDAALSAGAREAYTIEEPMAAAIGAGLPINEPIGSMIVDIGGGTTEVAVISLGGIVVNHSIRVAGDEIDDAIIQYARRDHNLVIGERTAENAKIAAGSAYPLEEEIRVTLRGRDLLTGLPKSVEVSLGRAARRHLPAGQHDRRGGEDRHRGDAARAGRRHHGAGHHPGRGWRALARAGPAAADGAEDAGLPRRRSPHLCRPRHRPRRRGAAPLRAGPGQRLGDPPRAIRLLQRHRLSGGASVTDVVSLAVPSDPGERPQ